MDTDALNRRFAAARSPFLDSLGVTFELTADGPVMRCRVAERHLRSHNIAHGGGLCTLLDTALGAAAYLDAHERLLEQGCELVTLQLETHFIRPAWDGEELIGRGEVVHSGRSTLVVRGDVRTAAGDLVVSGAGTFMPTKIAPDAD